MSLVGHSPDGGPPSNVPCWPITRCRAAPTVRHERADLSDTESAARDQVPREQRSELHIGPRPGRRWLVGILPYTLRTMPSSLLRLVAWGYHISSGEAAEIRPHI